MRIISRKTRQSLCILLSISHRKRSNHVKNGAKKKQVETKSNNQHFDLSYYADTVVISGQPFTFSIFSKSVFCGKVDTVKCVSVQPYLALSGFNQTFMEFIRFIAEQGNWNEKLEWR